MAQLYEEGEKGEIYLNCGACSQCGYTFFPFQDFGCERCGAFGSSIQSRLVAGRGKLRNSAAVYHHNNPNFSQPYSIVDVEIDDNLIVRGVSGEFGALDAGAEMVLELDKNQESSDELAGLRFVSVMEGGLS